MRKRKLFLSCKKRASYKRQHMKLSSQTSHHASCTGSNTESTLSGSKTEAYSDAKYEPSDQLQGLVTSSSKASTFCQTDDKINNGIKMFDSICDCLKKANQDDFLDNLYVAMKAGLL